MSFRISVNCTGCMRCAKTCPTGAITETPGDVPAIDPGRCVECGACGVACQDEAVLDQHDNLFSLGVTPRGVGAAVDLARCLGCGWCEHVCPYDAIRAVGLVCCDGGVMRFAVVIESRCVGCDGCTIECDAGALSMVRRDDPRWAARREESARHLRSCGVEARCGLDGRPEAM